MLRHQGVLTTPVLCSLFLFLYDDPVITHRWCKLQSLYKMCKACTLKTQPEQWHRERALNLQANGTFLLSQKIQDTKFVAIRCVLWSCKCTKTAVDCWQSLRHSPSPWVVGWEADTPLHSPSSLDTMEPRFLLSSQYKFLATPLSLGVLPQGWGWFLYKQNSCSPLHLMDAC